MPAGVATGPAGKRAAAGDDERLVAIAKLVGKQLLRLFDQCRT